MGYNIMLTTAEDVVGVVDAVLAGRESCNIQFVSDFADITETQAQNALAMGEQFGLICEDMSTHTFTGNSLLARLLVSTKNDSHKAAVMRLILEQYEPYITFRTRYIYTGSVESASRQVKVFYNMSSNYKDIKNTIISIATYANAMRSDCANQYTFNEDDVTYMEFLDSILKARAIDDNALKLQLGEITYDFIDKNKVYNPLLASYSKSRNETEDVKTIILYAGNAFESFLQQMADKHGISLKGRNGLMQKTNAMTAVLSKKHRGMIEYIGQIRNAADHGADVDEGGRIWDISDQTARIYPIVVAGLIKNICERDILNRIIV